MGLALQGLKETLQEKDRELRRKDLLAAEKERERVELCALLERSRLELKLAKEERIRMVEVEGVVEGERGRAVAAITAKKEEAERLMASLEAASVALKEEVRQA